MNETGWTVLNFNDWALMISVLVAVLSVPLFLLLRANHTVPPLLGFIVLMLAFGGMIGALGKLVDENLMADYWIRILIIATRLAAAGAILYDLKWFWDRRQKR